MFELRHLVWYTKDMLELLAPAGDMSALKSAINSGANAVYLGLDSFNARMRAQNFNADNIGEVVAYAHFYGVKVYVTINTILQNDEFNELILLVKAAVDAKVDAFLAQDLGVAKVLKECFDGIVLHASTQMGVHNLYGAKIAQELGFERVVLSREAKLEDIKAIHDNTNLEIEYFVQGALCVAFSGNCYLSSQEHGASGNRGLCKQLCRLPYRAELQGKTYDGYLLSARDLCLYNSVLELAKAGVSSFKIEGRLRRDGYVASVVQTYRKAIDLAECNERAKLNAGDMHVLKTAFSRGDYLKRAYLDDGTPSVIEKRFNNHTGEFVGVVQDVKEFKSGVFDVKIKAERALDSGDGLKFFDGDKEVASLGIGDAKTCGQNLYSITTTAKLKRGWRVNLITDAELEKQLLAKKRNVKISLDVKALVGDKLCVKAVCKEYGAPIFVEAQSDSVLDKAINAAMDAVSIASACSKVADSGFEIDECKVQTNGVFIAKSVIKATRRKALDELKEKIVEHNAPRAVRVCQDKIGECLSTIDNASVQNASCLHSIKSEEHSGIIIRAGERIILKPNVYSASSVKSAIALLDIDVKDVILDLPILANGKDLARIETLLKELGIKAVVSNNIYGLYFAKQGYEIVAGQGHNVANAQAELCLKALGAKHYAPSLEYPDFCGCGALDRVDVDQNLPLMTFAHCPYKTIFANDCSKCSYKPNLVLTREKRRYSVRRVVVDACRFELYPEK